MKKKIWISWTSVCMVVLLIFSLSACGNKEPESSEVSMFARVMSIGENGEVMLEPLRGDTARRSANRIAINANELGALDLCYYDLVEVIYTGEIMESYPAQIHAISWKKVTPQRDRVFEGEWLSKDDEKEKAVPSFGSFWITQIYGDCFFLEPLSDNYFYSIKVNGRLSEDFDIGDQVVGTFKNFRVNTDLCRAEMDCMTLDFVRQAVDKPVIYLYPEVETEVTVKLTVDEIGRAHV